MTGPARHVILTAGRSGSNSLVNLLNQHPEVLNYGEVLGDWTLFRRWQGRIAIFRKDDARYLDTLLGNRWLAWALCHARNVYHWRQGRRGSAKRFGDLGTIGVKEFALNLRRCGLSEYLAQRPGIRVIGLERENVVDRFLSSRMLGATGVVAARPGMPAPQAMLHLDPETLARDLERVARENRELAEMLDALPTKRVMRIRYEALYADAPTRHAILDSLHRFIGVAQMRPVLTMRKIIPGRSADRVANREACRRALLGTRFEGALD